MAYLPERTKQLVKKNAKCLQLPYSLFPVKMKVTTVDVDNFQKFECAGMSRKCLLDGKNERKVSKLQGGH